MTARSRLVVLGALAVVAALVPAALAAARAPHWWAWIAPEQTPMTWFQSVALVLAAAGSALLWYLGATAAPVGARHGYAVLAAGLGALALDERFALHERLRDGYLAPRDVRLPFLPWVGPGDFLLMGVAVVGLAVLPLVVRGFGEDRWSLALLAVGVALSVLAVGADSVDPASWTLAQERLEQTLEECVELAAGLALLGAVTLRLLGALAAVRTPRPVAQEAE